jgi:P4 family phage/plasmid primase-like protien
MENTQIYKDLSAFLVKHSAKNEHNISPTHTRIPDKELNVFGGSYIIPKEEYEIFYKLYYEHVFKNHKFEYLTEKQINNGPILIDIDLRYSYDVETRIHTEEHITDLIEIYLETLKDIVVFEPNKPFPIYVFEKPKVNRLIDKSLTKDGIHIIIGMQMDHQLQLILRERIISKIGDYWDLPIINKWDTVFDDCISKGTTNWQMFGSRKPGNEAYELVGHYNITYKNVDDDDEDSYGVNDSEFESQKKKISEFDFSKDLFKLSAQYDKHIKFEMNEKVKEEYDAMSRKTFTSRKNTNKPKIKYINDNKDDDDDDDNAIDINSIDCFAKLKNEMDKILSTLKTSEYYIREAHNYTQILPEKYYEPGSHEKNRLVAFALKHTDDRLFLSWVMLRSKASDFDYSSIPELYNKWNKYFKDKKNGVTIRSIIYWAKQDAFEDYQNVKKQTRDYFIDETINSPTDFDFATVLYQMFKDVYVCSSLVNKTWYVFKKHRWELDRGQSLRKAISVEMYSAYQTKTNELVTEMSHYESDDDRYSSLHKRIKLLAEISMKLKKTNDKNNIMREAAEIFFDEDFDKNMDSNKWLMCFSNGVVDLKNKTFRNGYPQDYISKSTNIPYEYFDENKHGETAANITKFMDQLFPDASLNNYMWEHLSSTLIGENINQTFNIYRGSGSNGKSILTDLMTETLGDYTGTVPVTLVTEKRVNIGGTSSEIMQLKGVRYAVMQEPSKDARINEGMMKQLTGDSTLSGRALYCETQTFPIQFHLVVCTNTLFEIVSNDDGTWRRIRICDFMSKFVDPDQCSNANVKYQYPKDKNLKDKLPQWAIVFASMLVKLAFQKQGIVTDCDIVKASSNSYRQKQDHISAFVNEMVRKREGCKIKKQELYNQFKMWMEGAGGKIPKGSELYEYMDNKFTKSKIGWIDVEIIYSNDDEMEDFNDE